MRQIPCTLRAALLLPTTCALTSPPPSPPPRSACVRSSSPDDKMWHHFYKQYLHHSKQNDNLAHSCTPDEPVPERLPKPQPYAEMFADTAGAAATT